MIDTTPEGMARVIANGESETAEFKLRLPPDHVVARELAAFSNTKGGILLIGVGDRGEILGLSDGEVRNVINRLHRITASLLPCPTNIGVVEIDGKNIVYAAVDEAPVYYPVTTSTGMLYQRDLAKVVEVPAADFLDLEIRAKISSVQPDKEAVAFVAMSFREEEEPALVDYFRAMERAVKATELPIKLVRVDLVEGDYEISQRIMDEIEKADIVIADFTLNSPNVYFELGYARGKNRYIIQTARKGTLLEFDNHNWRTVFYRNATELEKKRGPALKAAYASIVGR